jgi:hypothetical protein
MAQITLNSTGVASNGALVLQSNGTTTAVTIDTSQRAAFVAGTAALPAITTTGDTNTGIFFPAADTIAFTKGGAEAARIDSSGNFGLGVTPSAWSAHKILQVGSYATFGSFNGNLNSQMMNNAYWDGSSYRYIGSSQASYYAQATGIHGWYQAASGTAGNTVSFTQAMTLDASGNLGIGTTSATGKFTVNGANSSIVADFNETSGVPYIRVQNGTQIFGSGVTASTGWVGTISNHALEFRTNNTERARIDSSGNLLVGATSTLGSTAGILVANSGANVQAITTNSTSSSAYYIGRFYSGGTEKGYIYFDGTNVSYTNLSDYRLKENVQPMQNALDKVAQLNPVTYSWKSNGKAGQGFIAHELQAVVPDCVTGDKDALDEDGNPKYQGVDTSFLVATLTAAIQEQQALITQLTARLDAANL